MKRMLFAALAATIMFASCNKEDNNEVIVQDGDATTMGLSFSVPTATNTRADGDEITATADESKITSITVFAFKNNGSAAVGNNTRFGNIATEFDAPVSGVYKLKESHRIETTTATKKLYVVANLAAVSATDADTEAKLQALMATWDATGKTWLIPTTGMVMASQMVPVNLKTQLVNSVPTENEISADLERVSSKVVVTTNNSTKQYQQTLAQVNDAAFTITYTVNDWATGIVNTEAFLAQKFDFAGKLMTPTANRTGRPTTDAEFTTVNNSGVKGTWSGISYKYVGENAPESNKLGESTYIMIRTQAKPNRQASVVSGNVVWTPAGADLNSGFWILWNNTMGYEGMYFCKNEATADEVASKLVGTNFTKLEYKGGYVYYMVTLNLNKTAKATIFRNQFVHVDVTGVTNDVFVGMPGSGTDGTTPPDPEDPNNPEPWTPEEPVEEMIAYLQVNVVAKPWIYSGTEVELK